MLSSSYFVFKRLNTNQNLANNHLKTKIYTVDILRSLTEYKMLFFFKISFSVVELFYYCYVLNFSIVYDKI